MWKCPKCGRGFKKQDQGHYCIKPKTVDEYIAMQDERVQPSLQAVRSAIHEAIPAAQERIAWSMPAFWDGRNVIPICCVQASYRTLSRPGSGGKISGQAVGV